jgi:hypothetical protein
MRIEGAVLTLVLAHLASASPARAAVVSRIPSSVEEYARAIRADSTRDVEKLYRMGLGAAEDLMSEAGVESVGQYQERIVVLEALSDADYQATQGKMEGFIAFREEAVGVPVDPAFFAKLSRERGDAVSLDFFETLRGTMD